MHVLREQPVAIPELEGFDETFACLVATADQPERVDQPEPADQKGRLRQSEVVRTDVSHHVMLAAKFLVYHLDNTNEFGVIWFNQPEFGQEQHAGVELVGIDRGREGLAVRPLPITARSSP